MNADLISPEIAVDRMSSSSVTSTFIDVRSEAEFAYGKFEASINIPILNDIQRHEVGLAYKELGQEKAIQLGHELVDPIKSQLVDKWLEALAAAPEDQRFLYCWRGGMRSQLAAQWTLERGVRVARVAGGIKAIRNTLLKGFEKFPPLYVLGGMTGSGKTKIITHHKSAIDLEGLAQHRGSAFGSYVNSSQPSQASFENSLALKLWKKAGTILLEDESLSIGRVLMPTNLYKEMSLAPCVLVEISVNERARNIYDEYISAAQVSSEQLCSHFLICLQKISKKLGGLKTAEIHAKILAAFSSGVADKAAHCEWISDLLMNYYDKMYKYSLAKKNRDVVFRGNWQECDEWLGDKLKQ